MIKSLCTIIISKKIIQSTLATIPPYQHHRVESSMCVEVGGRISRSSLTQDIKMAGVKKSYIFTCPPGKLCQIFTCPVVNQLVRNMLSNILALNFLLVPRTLGENICLSCLKFYLSRAPGQVISYP